ncbi:hypothetical protein SNE40_012561 [Patella caerulea]|uniref:Uncharacterized protein n=1 Tax=Patella caerulea TaxID=87958 RepID=A0AAN8JQ52_PATCE
MCTLWMISVAFVLVSMLPSCRPADKLIKCNSHAECKWKPRSECIKMICYTDSKIPSLLSSTFITNPVIIHITIKEL